MKMITLSLIFLAVLQEAIAQCQQPTVLPYMENVESVIFPALPECMYSGYNSFSSDEVFESIPGPIPGFDGNILAYNTIVDNEFMSPNSPVSGYLISPPMQLVAGTQYIVSYRYGISNPTMTIGNVDVIFANNQLGNIAVSTHTNITGSDAVSFVSQPVTVTATGVYTLAFQVYSEGSQGSLYLDDFKVEQSPLMGIGDNILAAASIYPNPAHDVLFIDNDVPMESVVIYNIAGQVVQAYTPNEPQARLNIEQLPGGIYIVDVTAQGTQKHTRIIKQ